MTAQISVNKLRAWLYGSDELALLDVREAGQSCAAHILFSAPLPYSRFELGLARLVPNTGTRIVLYDDGDGVAERAARRAGDLGYHNVACLDGGAPAWAAAGYTLYEGVNVPSKAFGEIVEHVADTPRLPAAEIANRQRDGADMVIVDGRPLAEFAKINIPGAVCCPNGELVTRIRSIAPDPETTIIVNCAGRTRSIIGAQTLIDLGIPNPVFAMENGTQGWVLSGLELERGRMGERLAAPAEALENERASAERLAQAHGVATIDAGTLGGWIEDRDRTLFLLDVRTEDERRDDTAERKALIAAHGIVHAPGGQLVQATDEWIGVRRARLVVLDTEGIRAPVIASWLARLGHHASMVAGGIDALAELAPRAKPRAPEIEEPLALSAAELSVLQAQQDVTVLDLRFSGKYREGHIAGAEWTTRARLPATHSATPHVLIPGKPGATALVAHDLAQAGVSDIRVLSGELEDWRTAGLEIETTPDRPADQDRIDFLSHTHGRHDGNEAASRQYLAWEIALVDQLDPEERAVFRI